MDYSKHSKRVPGERDDLLKAYSKGLLFLEKDTKIQSTSLTNEGIEELSDNLLTRLNVGDYFDRHIYPAVVYLAFHSSHGGWRIARFVQESRGPAQAKRSDKMEGPARAEKVNYYSPRKRVEQISRNLLLELK